MPVGEVGVVYFAGGRPFEYHNDPAKTASIADEHGWRTLGDMGYLDADGYLYLTDRQAHMIISGGVNIYPQEAENVLVDHPAVADVAVIGVPDADMGEAVKAVVELVDPVGRRAPTSQRELLAHCRDELATYKCPTSDRLHRGTAAQRQRQALQAPPPRAVLGRPRITDLMSRPTLQPGA